MDVSGVQGDDVNRKSHSILFVTRCFPPTTGGMERFAFDLHAALTKNTKIKLLAWGGSKKALVFVLPEFFVRSFWALLTSKIDVIHAQDGVVSIMLTPLKRLFKKPMVVVIHGLDVTYKSGLYQRLIRWSLGRADRVICISEAAKAEVVKRGIDQQNVCVIPLGMTDELFDNDTKAARKSVASFVPSVKENNKILLSSGRLVERKGMDWFVANVMAKIVAKHPEAILLISGEGERRGAIEAAISDNNLETSVFLLGRTSDEQLKDLYNAADCFVMPNVSVPGDMEGFGRVLLEAALCATPVVASGIEGIVDAIVDEKNGTLVPEGAAEKHAQAILEILDNPESAKKRGKKAREFTLANYGWPFITNKYIDQYDDVTKVEK